MLHSTSRLIDLLCLPNLTLLLTLHLTGNATWMGEDGRRYELFGVRETGDWNHPQR